ncbi:hypothetical protein EJB05_44738, partial [Eragrostis curvula]
MEGGEGADPVASIVVLPPRALGSSHRCHPNLEDERQWELANSLSALIVKINATMRPRLLSLRRALCHCCDNVTSTTS